jgi:hypothetical protein
MSGSYEMLLTRTDLMKDSFVEVEGKKYLSLQKDNIYEDMNSYGSVTLPSNKEVKFIISGSPKNIAEDSFWVNLDGIKNQNETDIMTLESSNEQDGVQKEVKINPSTRFYKISLHYKTNNDTVKLRLYDQRKNDNDEYATNEYFRRYLRSTKWEYYETFVTFDKKALKIFLELSNKT